MQRWSQSLCGNAKVNALPHGHKPSTHDSTIQNIQQRFHIVVVNIFLGCVLPITGGKPAGGTTKSLNLCLQKSGRETPPRDLRESKNLVPLISDRNRRGSGVVVSCDPNAIIFEFIVYPWTESSGDSNLVSCGCGDHVGMTQVGDVPPETIESRGEVARLIIGESVCFVSSSVAVSWFSIEELKA